MELRKPLSFIVIAIPHLMRGKQSSRAASAAHKTLMPRRRAASWITTSRFALLAMTVFIFVSTTSVSTLAAPKPSIPPTLDDRFCQALVKHTPSADVAYQAGVDAAGRAVVPADLASTSTLALPDEITIPLTADLMTFLKMDASALPASAMGRGDIPLGTLTLRGNDVLWNGKPLSDPQQDNLAVLCLKPNRLNY